MSCNNIFQIAIPRSYAVMTDGETAYMFVTCGKFFPPSNDVVFCPDCEKAREADYERFLASWENYPDDDVYSVDVPF